jgi:hypothetical protein
LKFKLVILATLPSSTQTVTIENENKQHFKCSSSPVLEVGVDHEPLAQYRDAAVADAAAAGEAGAEEGGVLAGG